MHSPEHKKKAENRIQRHKENPNTRKPKNYVHSAISKQGFIAGVVCKMCGNAIKALIADDKKLTTEKRGTQTIVTKLLVLAESSTYVELAILFDDNSRHVTHGCRSCLKRSLSTDDLEALYIGDMQQQMTEEDIGRGELNWSLWMDRKPISSTITRENGSEVVI